MNTLEVSKEFFYLVFLVILASFVFYNFSNENFILSFLGILFGLLYYILFLLFTFFIQSKRKHEDIFVEALGILSLFLFPLLAYGFKLFQENVAGIILIVIFAIMQLLNFVRNWSNGVNHTKGFPVVLHGLFFPLTYFVAHFYATGFEEAVFMVYFIITGILSATSYNFIKYQHSVFEEDEEGNKTSYIKSINENDTIKTVNLDENKKSINIKDKFRNIISNITNIFKKNKKNLTKIQQKDIMDEDSDVLNSIEKIKSKTERQDDEILQKIPKVSYKNDLDDEDEKFLNSLSRI